MDDNIVEVLSRKLIKPHSPTPPDRRNYTLSAFDRATSSIYIPLMLFYTKSQDSNTTRVESYSSLLEKSLSETLTQYYPFAGRIESNGKSVFCNDEGVIFLEAQLRCNLSLILENPNEEILNSLFPDNLQWKEPDEDNGIITAIQANFLDCGGLAIGVCMSNKIGDVSTMISFLNYWAAMASRLNGQVQPQVSPPDLLNKAATSFPIDPLPPIPKGEPNKIIKFVSRRYVFDAANIAALKAMVADIVPNPSSVEVVTAFLYKCAIKASATNFEDDAWPSALFQYVDMRPMVPHLAENSVGNFLWFFTVFTEKPKEPKELSELVGEMKQEMAHLCYSFEEEFNEIGWDGVIRDLGMELEKSLSCIVGPALGVYRSNNWCGLPLYEVNFGFGKPIWVSVPSCFYKNGFILMDTNTGDGIEAIVCLELLDMAVFGRDQELLTFASSNPRVLGTPSESFGD